jgi:hypothetical protein
MRCSPARLTQVALVATIMLVLYRRTGVHDSLFSKSSCHLPYLVSSYICDFCTVLFHLFSFEAVMNDSYLKIEVRASTALVVLCPQVAAQAHQPIVFRVGYLGTEE